MIINKTEINPGENKIIRINVASLASGTKINIVAHVFRSERPGPTLLVLGGMHGDEINGVEIVRRSIKSGLFDQLSSGSVIAIPVLNVFGFINFSRELPDGKDVNRSFPGSSRGSLASRTAHYLTRHILPHIDFGIDFHTGGSSVYNYPQIRVAKTDQSALELAQKFAPPYIIKTGLIPKSLRKECTKRKIPMLVYEGGESLRLDEYSIQEGIRGLERLMVHREMIENAVTQKTSLVFSDSTWVRAAAAGLFVCAVKSGQEVKKGEPLGKITDPYGVKETIVRSSKDGFIYGHNNRPVVNAGDALFHIGYNVSYIEYSS